MDFDAPITETRNVGHITSILSSDLLSIKELI